VIHTKSSQFRKI